MVLVCPAAHVRKERRNVIATTNLYGRMRSSDWRFSTVGYHGLGSRFTAKAKAFNREDREEMPLRTRRKSKSRACAGLAFSAAGHQLLDGFARGLAPVQDGVHLLGDGHFHCARTGESYCGGGSEYSFSDHA